MVQGMMVGSAKPDVAMFKRSGGECHDGGRWGNTKVSGRRHSG